MVEHETMTMLDQVTGDAEKRYFKFFNNLIQSLWPRPNCAAQESTESNDVYRAFQKRNNYASSAYDVWIFGQYYAMYHEKNAPVGVPYLGNQTLLPETRFRHALRVVSVGEMFQTQIAGDYIVKQVLDRYYKSLVGMNLDYNFAWDSILKDPNEDNRQKFYNIIADNLVGVNKESWSDNSNGKRDRGWLPGHEDIEEMYTLGGSFGATFPTSWAYYLPNDLFGLDKNMPWFGELGKPKLYYEFVFTEHEKRMPLVSHWDTKLPSKELWDASYDWYQKPNENWRDLHGAFKYNVKSTRIDGMIKLVDVLWPKIENYMIQNGNTSVLLYYDLPPGKHEDTLYKRAMRTLVWDYLAWWIQTVKEHWEGGETEIPDNWKGGKATTAKDAFTFTYAGSLYDLPRTIGPKVDALYNKWRLNYAFFSVPSWALELQTVKMDVDPKLASDAEFDQLCINFMFANALPNPTYPNFLQRVYNILESTLSTSTESYLHDLSESTDYGKVVHKQWFFYLLWVQKNVLTSKKEGYVKPGGIIPTKSTGPDPILNIYPDFGVLSNPTNTPPTVFKLMIGLIQFVFGDAWYTAIKDLLKTTFDFLLAALDYLLEEVLPALPWKWIGIAAAVIVGGKIGFDYLEKKAGITGSPLTIGGYTLAPKKTIAEATETAMEIT
jgi:hypothetical protein